MSGVKYLESVKDGSLIDVDIPWTSDVKDCAVKLERLDESVVDQKIQPIEEDQLPNPWDVKSLFQFQYFNCPECLFKVHEKQTFVDHAFDSHPESVKFLNILEDESMTGISLPWNNAVDIKVEPEIVSDSKDDIDDDYDMNEYYSDHSNSSDEFIPIPTKRKKKKKPPKESTFLEQSQVQCYCCGIMLKVEEIRSHISASHGNYAVEMFGEPQPFQCFKCNATFETKFKCDRHVCFDVFVPDKPGKGKGAKYQCDQCPKELETSTDYRHHMIQYHTSNAIKPFECPECDFNTKLSLNLNDHIVRQHNKDGSFVCDQCDLTFPYESLLMNHVKVKHQEIKLEVMKPKPYLCTICGVRFDREHAYIKHKQKHENEDGTAKCDSCGDQFHDIDKFEEHILSFHPKMDYLGSYNCDKCDKSFCHTTVLDFHYLKSHGESGVSCYICLKRLSKKSKMKAHIEVVHEKSAKGKASNNHYKCDKCDFRGPQSQLNKHCEEAHPDSPYLCDKCDYKSYSKINFAKHVRDKHSSIPWFHCDKCDFASPNHAKLKRHVEGVHLNLKPYQCHICPKAVKSQRQLNYHLVKVHSVTMSQEVMDQVEKDFSCTKGAKPKPVEPKCLKCDTLCDSEEDLNQHVALCYKGLINGIEFKCNKCDSQWSSAEALHYHLYNTHFYRGCVCDMCGRIFTNYNYLVTHKASHLNIKRFACDLCDKKYTTKVSLEAHVNADHVKTQEFFCDQCDYKTLRDTAMRMHVKTKHTVDAFKCKFCDFASNSPKLLRTHQKKVHTDIKIESQRITKIVG